MCRNPALSLGAVEKDFAIKGFLGKEIKLMGSIGPALVIPDV
jgi:hypothetical protein